MLDKNPRYKWPRYALALVIVFLVVAVVWVFIKAHTMEQERNFDAPIPTR
jgi:hypothetical protein